jgi:hypothetical protein
MPKLKYNDPKDDQMFVRVKRKMGDRVRRAANHDGQTVSEWIRLAMVERLDRVERRRGGGGPDGTAQAAVPTATRVEPGA